MISPITYSRTRLESGTLEHLCGSASVAFDTAQNACGAVLEALGSRSSDVPTILPITAPAPILAATLRAGAMPCLIDIDAATLQMDPKELEAILSQLHAAVVVFPSDRVDPVLLEVCTKREVVTVQISAFPRIQEENLVCTFTIFDLADLCDSGAVLICKYKDVVGDLKQVRTGLLGLGAKLSPFVELHAVNSLKTLREVDVSGLLAALSKAGLPFILHDSRVFVATNNAGVAVAHIADLVETKKLLPLHQVEQIARRWTEQPSYPVAEKAALNWIAIPVHEGILGKESMIVSRLKEVCK